RTILRADEDVKILGMPDDARVQGQGVGTADQEREPVLLQNMHAIAVKALGLDAQVGQGWRADSHDDLTALGPVPRGRRGRREMGNRYGKAKWVPAGMPFARLFAAGKCAGRMCRPAPGAEAR